MDADLHPSDPWSVTLGSLPTEAFIDLGGDASIAEAATRMTEVHASAALIGGPQGWSIVTDRDLRARVLAGGRDPRSPVRDIASGPLASLPPEATASEALSLMLERGIHHVPVVAGGAVLALVTDTDLLALERRSAVRLRREVETAGSVDDLASVGRRAPEMLADLVGASMDPLAVGHAAGVLHDALVIRAIELAIKGLGEPPCPWAWLALGSQARHEQAIATDQDHGLLYEPEGGDADAVDPYFERLATAVTETVAAAGIPACRAGVVASGRDWRGTPQEWASRFEHWATDMDPTSMGFAAIIFDHRAVAGPLDAAAAIGGAAAEIGRRPALQRRLARWAVDAKTPRGLLRGGTKAVRLDIKHEGIAPLTSLGRIFGLMSQARTNRTLGRVQAAVKAQVLPANDGAALEEAFRLLWRIRLRHQAEQVRVGVPPDDRIDLGTLGPLERRALRDAFRAIDAARQVMRLDLDIRR